MICFVNLKFMVKTSLDLIHGSSVINKPGDVHFFLTNKSIHTNIRLHFYFNVVLQDQLWSPISQWARIRLLSNGVDKLLNSSSFIRWVICKIRARVLLQVSHTYFFIHFRKTLQKIQFYSIQSPYCINLEAEIIQAIHK